MVFPNKYAFVRLVCPLLNAVGFPVTMDVNYEPALFREVLQCFARFPQRDDTLQGITQWWLLENRIEWAVSEVHAALDALVARGLVIARRTIDGQTHYKVNPAARERIDALLREAMPIRHH